ncbi:hypothetical protein V1J52_12000 [Streptomyces sp. TRM 70351]|uniref:hypothetical protein n=1 Tax=Streptomyces sp. TRM 70351 TaxID=3116552 RepID=UPI002E7B228D|nr:hypothetical protein [Streptomyces sp. TRM 70351]MEE1928890.1 hypothetical protein [Streptomyces sp. TRM 70351]
MRPTRRTGLTRFIDDVVTSAHDLVDETLDRASDAERDLRRGLTRLVDDDGRTPGKGRRRRSRRRDGRRARYDDRRHAECREAGHDRCCEHHDHGGHRERERSD